MGNLIWTLDLWTLDLRLERNPEGRTFIMDQGSYKDMRKLHSPTPPSLSETEDFHRKLFTSPKSNPSSAQNSGIHKFSTTVTDNYLLLKPFSLWWLLRVAQMNQIRILALDIPSSSRHLCRQLSNLLKSFGK